MTTASLSLLKKGNKAALNDELTKAPVVVDTVVETEENTVVDITKMSEVEIDAMVAEQGIETPADWAGLNLKGKVTWLEATFGASDESTGAEVKAAAAADAGTTQELAAAHAILAGSPTTETVKTAQEIIADEAKAASTKTKGKKKAKGTAVEASTTKSGEIVGPDVLADIVHEIENLKEPEALAQIGLLTEQTEMTFFRLGGILSLVQSNAWYAPYATFRAFVETEHGMGYHKATYFIQIYNCLVESGVPWEKVKSVGWTKLKEIAKVINNDNVDEWVKIATAQTTINLIDTVKKHVASGAPVAIEDQSSKTVTTKTFKVHEDQKLTIEAAINKAKEATGTAVDTAALEFICLDYMGGMSMKDKLMKLGLEAAANLLQDAFPNADISVELKEEIQAA